MSVALKRAPELDFLYREKKRRRAINNINAFTEYCMRDSRTGFPFKQASLHRTLQAFIEKNLFPVIIIPREHGKTAQVISRILFELGKNHNELVKMVCASDTIARKRVMEVRENIAHNADLHEIFPDLLEDKGVQSWSKHAITVERDIMYREPSLEASGILCLSGETDVVLESGILKKLKKMKIGERIFGVDEGLRMQPCEVLGFEKRGLQEVYLLKTLSGRSLRATLNHRFLTIGGWKRLSELGIGDRIASLEELKIERENRLESWEPVLLGLMLGDGYCGSTKHESSANLTAVESGIYDKFKELCSEVGWSIREGGPKNRQKTPTFGPFTLRTVLRKFGMWGKRAKNKRVPNQLFSAPRKQVAEFLGGYFSTDGHVDIPGFGLLFSSSNGYLLKQVQHLLTRLGICSVWKKVKNEHGFKNEEHPSKFEFRLELFSDQAINFANCIPVYGKRDKELRSLLSFLQEKKRKPKLTRMPEEVRKYLDHSLDWHRVHDRQGMGTGNFSRENMRKVAVLENNKKLSTLVNNDIFWDRITLIKNLGREQTYDIEVSGSSNFIANGFVTHNSTGVGGRTTFLVFDDPVDLRNAILNPAQRQSVKDAFYEVWMNLLDEPIGDAPPSRMIYIATPWHEDDLTHELKSNPSYKVLELSIDENFTPLWPEKWPMDRLKQKLGQIKRRAFDRNFRNIALTEEELMFNKNALYLCKDVTASPYDKKYDKMDKYAGVDLGISEKAGAAYTVIFVIGVDEGSVKHVLSIKRKRMSSPSTARAIKDTNEAWHPKIFMVENNAYQDALIQWMEEIGYAGLPIQPFTTGKNKADPNTGLPSLAVEFERLGWNIPMSGSDHEQDCQCPICIWLSEMCSYPIGKYNDAVMGCWFAREAARSEQKSFKPGFERW